MMIYVKTMITLRSSQVRFYRTSTGQPSSINSDDASSLITRCTLKKSSCFDGIQRCNYS